MQAPDTKKLLERELQNCRNGKNLLKKQLAEAKQEIARLEALLDAAGVKR